MQYEELIQRPRLQVIVVLLQLHVMSHTSGSGSHYVIATKFSCLSRKTGHTPLICSTSPSSYNSEQLATTAWSEPFSNYRVCDVGLFSAFHNMYIQVPFIVREVIKQHINTSVCSQCQILFPCFFYNPFLIQKIFIHLLFQYFCYRSHTC